MIEIEQVMREFNARQKPCKHSGKCPRIHWTGIHVIACGKECECALHDGEHHSPQNIIDAWDTLHP